MNELIARLIRCGMTRDVALWAMRKYAGDRRAFEMYVEEIEEASREPVDLL